MAASVGMDCPVNRTIVELIKQKEKKEITSLTGTATTMLQRIEFCDFRYRYLTFGFVRPKGNAAVEANVVLLL